MWSCPCQGACTGVVGNWLVVETCVQAVGSKSCQCTNEEEAFFPRGVVLVALCADVVWVDGEHDVVVQADVVSNWRIFVCAPDEFDDCAYFRVVRGVLAQSKDVDDVPSAKHG